MLKSFIIGFVFYSTFLFSEGRVESWQFPSQILHNQHEVTVYIPAEKPQGDKYPLLIVFDGEAYTHSEVIPTPDILDQLIAKKSIPPVMAVFIANATDHSRNWELPCNPRFVTFLQQEILPWMIQNFPASSNASEVIVCGSSYGGLAALYAAAYAPESFGNVLSQSGSFDWNHDALFRVVEQSKATHLNVYMDIGTKEDADSIQSNVKMASLLKKKGFQVTFTKFEGEHDYDDWRKTLPQGLKALFAQKK